MEDILKSNAIEWLGLCSAALTTAAFLPQVFQVWSARPTPATAISLPMYILFVIGVAGWLLYGILIRRRPVWIANALVLILASLILVYKFIYG